MDLFGKKTMLGQGSHYAIKKSLQHMGGNRLDVGGDRIRADRASDLGWLPALCFTWVITCIRGRLFLPSVTCTVSYLPAVEPYKTHKRLRSKYDGVYMPEKRQPCHYAHQVDKNNRREFYIAFTLLNIRIKLHEQIHEAESLKEVKELIKESGFAKAIDLRDIFAVSQVFGNARLVSLGCAPGKAISDFPGSPFDQIHAMMFIMTGRGCQAGACAN